MKRKSKEEQSLIVKKYIDGETVMDIAKKEHLSRSTIYTWINAAAISKEKTMRLKDFSHMKQEFEKLQKVVEILQSAPCTASAPLHTRLDAIEQMSGTYHVHTLCFALKVPKGTYYNHILRNKRDNTIYAKRKAELKPLIEEIYHKSNEIYGPNKVCAILRERGYVVTEKTIADIMHENNWFSIKGGAKALYLQNQKRRENLLNQQFIAPSPNKIWVSDVTYYKFNGKTFYICVIMDLFSRMVIAHKISLKNNTALTKRTFKLAYELRCPAAGFIFHSDNGMNYSNSVCESFFCTLKTEELYRSNYKSEKDLISSIANYISFYNSERPHSYLRYMSPLKYENKYYRSHPKKFEQDGSDFDMTKIKVFRK